MTPSTPRPDDRPARQLPAQFAVYVVDHDDGWLVICHDHSWLHGDLESALIDVRAIAQGFGTLVRLSS